MDNRRVHPRIPMTVSIKISHPDIGEKLVKTKNISDSGVFILVEPTDMPAIGTIVSGQVQGIIDSAPELDMEIVRTESNGLGLRYVDAE